MSDNSRNEKEIIERRKFERAYFSSDDEITGTIVVSDPAAPPITGNICHLSIGGRH